MHVSTSRPIAPARRRRFLTGRLLAIYAALIVLGVLFLVPFYIMLRNAFLTDLQITSPDFIWLPLPPHLDNFSELFSDPDIPILTGLRNSAIIAVSQTALQMLFACMAGYGLARVPVRGKGIVLAAILATMMIPGAALFVPKYVLVSNFGWVNTLQGIIVPDLFSAFATFMFRQFYLDFPLEMEEAGRADGLGFLGLFWFLALPNSKGVITALGLLAFIWSWNAFLWPLVIGQDPNLWTVQVDVSAFLTNQTVNLHEIFLASVMAILPVAVLFALVQRWIVEGVKLQGSKG
ncbi:MAG: carbohydrate transporter permease [Chloroflexi bacterium]|nr:carbohydrate transporter permease [Chloroflexota bacterium]